MKPTCASGCMNVGASCGEMRVHDGRGHAEDAGAWWLRCSEHTVCPQCSVTVERRSLPGIHTGQRRRGSIAVVRSMSGAASPVSESGRDAVVVSNIALDGVGDGERDESVDGGGPGGEGVKSAWEVGEAW